MAALQRARAHLTEVAPTEDGTAEPADRERRKLVSQYPATFEQADIEAPRGRCGPTGSGRRAVGQGLPGGRYPSVSENC